MGVGRGLWRTGEFWMELEGEEDASEGDDGEVRRVFEDD